MRLRAGLLILLVWASGCIPKARYLMEHATRHEQDTTNPGEEKAAAVKCHLAAPSPER